MIDSFVLDHGLWVIPRTTTRLLLNKTEATNYDMATNSANVLGQKSRPLITGPMDATPTGRKVVVNAIVDGVINIGDTATSWCLVDDNVGRLLVSELLETPIDLEIGDLFVTEAIDIRMPGEL
jgi:hypothetical protein